MNWFLDQCQKQWCRILSWPPAIVTMITISLSYGKDKNASRVSVIITREDPNQRPVIIDFCGLTVVLHVLVITNYALIRSCKQCDLTMINVWPCLETDCHSFGQCETSNELQPTWSNLVQYEIIPIIKQNYHARGQISLSFDCYLYNHAKCYIQMWMHRQKIAYMITEGMRWAFMWDFFIL